MTTFQGVFTCKDIHVKGELKRLWHKVGVLKETKGGAKFLHLFHQPNIDYYVFSNKKEALAIID